MKHFLEYLTPKEREKAGKEGQTNLGQAKLDKAAPRIKYVVPDWLGYGHDSDADMINSYKKIYRELHINSFPAGLWRGVFIFDENTLYTMPVDELVHDDIVMSLLVGNKFEKPREDEFMSWHISLIDRFACLITYSPKIVVLAESYNKLPVNHLRKDNPEKVAQLTKYFKERKMLFVPYEDSIENQPLLKQYELEMTGKKKS